MSDKLRRILAWFIIGCNAVLALVGATEVLSTDGDKTMLFLVLAFALNAGLLFDYVGRLKKIERDEKLSELNEIREQTRRRVEENNRAIREDRELAEEIRASLKNRAEEELSVEELRELLQRKENSQNESLHG